MAKRFEVLSLNDAAKAGIDPLILGMKNANDFEFGWCIVEHLPDGTLILIGCDGGEPEDQLLVRDWSWVAPALNAAFDAGKDARDEVAREALKGSA